LVLTIPGRGAVISVSEVRIEPTGYEDPTTHEWKGSFWVIAAVTDTKESILLYEFDETEANSFGQNEIDDKTIIPTATIKITITPRQPYWETSLKEVPYMIYPITYGAWDMKTINDRVNKWTEHSVPALNVKVLENEGTWARYTPFDVKIEKFGNNSFTRTISNINTNGGTDTIVIENPSDSSEKLMIKKLGQLDSGYGQPTLSCLTIFINGEFERFVFEGEDVRNAIPYGRDLTTGTVTEDECYAFYWFGGGEIHDKDGHDVLAWEDDKSCAHKYIDPPELSWEHLVEEDNFSGSTRIDDFWTNRIVPESASIFVDNDDVNPSGWSLVNYLKYRVSDAIDLDKWGQGWTITENNMLRIYMPSGAASSLITIKVSTELADSVVYQPIVGLGTIEQCFWDSSKTTQCSIEDGDSDVAILKVKQSATESSKLTVTPYVPANIPVSVIPQKDSAIIDPESVHTFQFEVSSLGTDTKQNAIITFNVTNDAGTTTDSQTLEFELKPPEKEPENSEPDDTPDSGEPDGVSEPLDSGDPLFVVLVVIIVLTVITGTAYSLRTHLPSRRKQT